MMPNDYETIIEQDKKRIQQNKAEDINFVENQRGPRQQVINTEDKRYVRRMKKAERRKKFEVSSFQENDPVPGPSTLQSAISSSSSETGCLSEESSFDIENAQSPEEDISDILVSTDSVVQDTVLTAQAQLKREVSTSTGISIPGDIQK